MFSLSRELIAADAGDNLLRLASLEREGEKSTGAEGSKLESVVIPLIGVQVIQRIITGGKRSVIPGRQRQGFDPVRQSLEIDNNLLRLVPGNKANIDSGTVKCPDWLHELNKMYPVFSE